MVAEGADLTDRDVVLFDAGGTLIALDYDRLRSAVGAARDALADELLDRAEGVARAWGNEGVRAGLSTDELWDGYFSRLLTGAGFPGDDLGEALSALWDANRAQGLWRRAIPGGRELLARLAAAGRRLAVVSNAEGQVEADLRDLGLADHLETVVDSHLAGVAKPDPRIFEIALERLGVPAEDCVYVGDVPAYDVDGARAAGIEPILIDPFDNYVGLGVRRARSLAELLPILGVGTD